MKFLALSLIAGAFLVLVVATSNAESDDSQISNNEIETARRRFVLPKLFDFSRFKQLFRKSYRSFVEELARQKLFLARAFKAVISMVKYKHERADHYQSINQMSDNTPSELRKRMLTPEQLLRGSRKIHGRDRPSPTIISDELPVAGVDEIEKVIEEVKTRKGEPGYREIAEEFEQVNAHARRKREVNSGKRRQISLDDLLPSEETIRHDSREYRGRIPSNNRDYEPLELISFGSEDTEKNKPMEPSLIDRISSMPGIGGLISMIRKTSNEISTVNTPDTKEAASSGGGDLLPDIVYADHSKSKCFFEPRDQGQCGSCWAFSTIAMFEYMHCRQTGKLKAFSEQFMIDCGKHSSPDLEGCEGGNDDVATDFVFEYGLQLRLNYPYLEKDNTCPYENHEGLKKAGYLVLNEPKEYREVSLENIEKVLERVPILMGLLVTDDFLFYGGGIHKMAECLNDEMAHAMVLVGHGRQDGVEYFLFRNSHSTAWGERGYYKVSKESFHRCAADPYGAIVRGRF